MKHIAIAAVCSLALASAAQAQMKDSAVVVDETEAVVTVTKVDKQARKVTFRGPKGGVATLTVPKEAQSLDQVKPGQQYKLKYVEAVAVAIHKGGKPAAAAAEEVNLAPKGAKPGGTVVRTVHLAGVVDAIDYTNRYVAVRGPKGNTVSLKVAPDVPLDQLSAGDRISVTHTEALAIEMAAQAPAAKKGK
jgi:Cu/Ag efflux protein CusF